MAGDLLIVDISFNQKQTLEQSGATIDKAIFHSDKSWGQFSHVLEERLRLGPPNNRRNLPAHAYITFNSANRHVVDRFCQDRTQKARLNDVLVQLARPLGVVSNNPNLGNWPGNNTWDGAANLLLDALTRGNVIIEYYKQDRSPIMDVFGKDPNWKKHPE
jgi:hypothetical protein